MYLLPLNSPESFPLRPDKFMLVIKLIYAGFLTTLFDLSSLGRGGLFSDFTFLLNRSGGRLVGDSSSSYLQSSLTWLLKFEISLDSCASPLITTVVSFASRGGA